MSENSNQLLTQVEEAVRAVLRRDFPGRLVSDIRPCAEEFSRVVVRVYLPVESLIPTPYVIYAVDRGSLVARRLTGDEAKPYEVPRYK